MKMKPMPRPPTPRRVPRRMVKTLHARAATGEKDFEEYEDESEPNMKFWHAVIVVLILHVLFIGGVFAFNILKVRHIAPDRAKPAAGQAAPEAVPGTRNKTTVPTREAARTLPAAPNKTSPKTQPADAAATHTVVAGDTLTRIATWNKTTVEAIEQANGIVGSSALRVGQVLKIPAKSSASKAPAKQETVAAKTAEAKPAASAKTSETKPATAAKTSEMKPATAAKTSEAKPAATNKTSEVKPAVSAVKNPEVKPTPVAKTKETTAAAKSADDGPAKAAASPAASDKTYTVAKGDNPYSIAKKMKVKYNDLIKANDIKDPTKLQIGQKLIIP
jgi:LysM repeat protein